jgi:hypothetical protein
MAKYRVTIRKVMEDGKELTVEDEHGEGWYISPRLKTWSKKYREPMPKPLFTGEVALPGMPRAA